MPENLDKEEEAINPILISLDSLDENARKNVIEYILKLINYFVPESSNSLKMATIL